MNVKNASKDRKMIPARRNPFATEHVTKIAFRFEKGDWTSNLRRLVPLGFRCAIIGPQGSGKTTLLADLEMRLNDLTDQEAHYVFLPQEKEEHHELVQDAISASEKGKVVLLDGLERLALRKKFNLFRATHRGGLIVTAHNPMRLPPFNLPTWIKTETSELLLDYILAELKMDSPDVRAAGKAAMVKHRGNVRNVLRDLYDRHASKRFR